MTQGFSIRALDWDSTFFGLPVASLDSGTMGLDEAVAGLRAGGFRLCYLQVDPGDLRLDAAARDCGGHLADRRVELEADVPAASSGTRTSWEVLSRDPPIADRQALAELALASGERSRFRTDPRIPSGDFERLYRVWIDNSIDGSIADAVLVARESGQVAGMITVAARAGAGEIGLFAVDGRCRGRGLGRKLLQGALNWAADCGCVKLRVATQADNANALAAYCATGFAISRTVNVFHFWIEPR